MQRAVLHGEHGLQPLRRHALDGEVGRAERQVPLDGGLARLRPRADDERALAVGAAGHRQRPAGRERRDERHVQVLEHGRARRRGRRRLRWDVGLGRDRAAERPGVDDRRADHVAVGPPAYRHVAERHRAGAEAADGAVAADGEVPRFERAAGLRLHRDLASDGRGPGHSRHEGEGVVEAPIGHVEAGVEGIGGLRVDREVGLQGVAAESGGEVREAGAALRQGEARRDLIEGGVAVLRPSRGVGRRPVDGPSRRGSSRRAGRPRWRCEGGTRRGPEAASAGAGRGPRSRPGGRPWPRSGPPIAPAGRSRRAGGPGIPPEAAAGRPSAAGLHVSGGGLATSPAGRSTSTPTNSVRSSTPSSRSSLAEAAPRSTPAIEAPLSVAPPWKA